MKGTLGARASKYVTCVTLVIVASLLPQPIISLHQHSISGKCKSSVAVSVANKDVYANLGDVNIGGYMLNPVIPGFNLASLVLQMTEAIVFAVKLVNNHPKLLPNVSLGFALLQEGYNTNEAVANTLKFLPRTTYDSESDNACICSSSSVPKTNTSQTTDHHHHQYDVSGVITPAQSFSHVAVSYILSAAKIPLFNSAVTFEELGDNIRHPYFLEVFSFHKFMAEVILEFIHSNGWSYISALYMPGPLGETIYQRIKSLAPHYNICIATSHEIKTSTEFDYVVKDLLEHLPARVVILLIYPRDLIRLFQAINRYNASDTFILIYNAAIDMSLKHLLVGYEKDISGTFVFFNHYTLIPTLYRHIRKLKINTTTNPWMKSSIEFLTGCSFTKGTCDSDSSFLNSTDFVFYNFTSVYVDLVLVFAHAITNLLADLCPGLTGAEARHCIKGEDLLRYIENVSFEGYNGPIRFGRVSHVNRRPKIQQIGTCFKNTSIGNSSSVYDLVSTVIAKYSTRKKQLKYTGSKISWDHLTRFSREANLPITSQQQNPESVCSKPCKPGQYIIYKQSHCCWDCGKCQEHERIVNEKTACEDCSRFTWPDPDTGLTTCQDITITFRLLRDPDVIILLSLGILAVVCAVAVAASFVHFRDYPIIKTSSRELSFLQLVAVGVGCLTVILLQLPPSDRICGIVYFTFSLSLTWLYSPLLVKSLRIYRIFLGGSRHHGNPRFISCYSQIGLTIILISVQIILCLTTYTVYKPGAKKSQPVPMEKFVELTCDMALPGLLSFLTYNLVLAFICSVLAFKTRHLSENFNESWYIFMCVATTLIIWLGFVPTYFTASRASVKTLMLSAAILLNHFVALVFLFIPKIYAAVNTCAEVNPKSKFQFSTVQTSLTNRVAPTTNELANNKDQVK